MRRKRCVGFVLAPHFTLLALSALVDTLWLAADEGDRSRPILCAWTVLSDTMRRGAAGGICTASFRLEFGTTPSDLCAQQLAAT